MFQVSFGVGNKLTRNEVNYANVAEVLIDTSLQAALAFDPAQVDARVNGVVVDPGTAISANMRIELIKKAGRKSSNELPMTHENQLCAIGISVNVCTAICDASQAALEPFFAAVEKAESESRKSVAAAQRTVLKECKPFNEYVDGLIEQLVVNNYVDSVGSLTVPQAVREELDALVSDASEALKEIRTKLEDAEKARAKIGVINQWLHIRTAKGIEGYVAAWYVLADNSAPDTELPPDTLPDELTVYVIPLAARGLRMRSGPSTGYPITKVLMPNTALTVLDVAEVAIAKIGAIGEWLHVQDGNGVKGYVAAWYVIR